MNNPPIGVGDAVKDLIEHGSEDRFIEYSRNLPAELPGPPRDHANDMRQALEYGMTRHGHDLGGGAGLFRAIHRVANSTSHRYVAYQYANLCLTSFQSLTSGKV